MNDRRLDPGSQSKVDEALEGMGSEVAESSAEEIDPASYRDLTKEEVLQGIAVGYRDFLEGNYKPADERYDELGWQPSDDAT